jgi:enoyl-CoA hydratase/carnithine racemase
VWEKTRTEGAKVLQRLIDLLMPVVGVANRPALVHSEYLLLADIHIASEHAIYGDVSHPAFGITGGDGPHVVWKRSPERREQSGCCGPASASTRRSPYSGVL